MWSHPHHGRDRTPRTPVRAAVMRKGVIECSDIASRERS
ncbi:hypothetical protein SGL43_04079 [Streptomyces globisporus]|uniref:Uncharacterized protein n=1 Tax=Streptomyces globisporus TaxID=1908 RepID=A0ABN8V3E1_STRGL|nr:hypothetical protein SGL43_04079 [Streptomyces globisporus]